MNDQALQLTILVLQSKGKDYLKWIMRFYSVDEQLIDTIWSKLSSK